MVDIKVLNYVFGSLFSFIGFSSRYRERVFATAGLKQNIYSVYNGLLLEE